MAQISACRGRGINRVTARGLRGARFSTRYRPSRSRAVAVSSDHVHATRSVDTLVRSRSDKWQEFAAVCEVATVCGGESSACCTHRNTMRECLLLTSPHLKVTQRTHFSSYHHP